MNELWQLLDLRNPLEPGQEFPTTDVHGADQLRRVLESLSTEGMGMFFLKSPSGDGLRLALSGAWGVVECQVSSSPHFGKATQGLSAHDMPEYIEFVNEGLDEPFWPSNLIPTQQAIEIAVDFYRTGNVPDSVSWKDREWGDYAVG